MNETNSTLQDDAVNPTFTVVFTSLAAASVLVNITYIIVCFKALRKTFHHLTILALFFSDIICGATPFVFSLAPVIKHVNVGSCLLQMFLVTFSLQSNYCLILLLCLQRYLVVRSYNFGTSQTFDRNKYVYIAGAMCLMVFLSFCGTILPPRVEFIQVCVASVLYGDSYYIFVNGAVLPICVIIFLILIMSLINGFRLLKLHFKGKVAPSCVVNKATYSTNHEQCSVLTTDQRSVTLSKNIFIDMKQNQIQIDDSSVRTIADVEIRLDDSSVRTIADVEIRLDDSSVRTIEDVEIRLDDSSVRTIEDVEIRLDDSSVRTIEDVEIRLDDSSVRTIADVEIRLDDSSVRTIEDLEIRLDNFKANSKCDYKESTQIDNWVQENKLNKGPIGMNSRTNVCTTPKDVSTTPHVNTQLKKSWEIRAFFTTIIIAFQTVVLTGPFIFTFYIELFSNEPMKRQSRLLLAMPYFMNTFSNPFIYAWRIPEIRQEFRKVFRLNT